MSGWTAVTVHPPKNLSGPAEEEAKERIEESLEQMYGEDAGGYAARTVQETRGARDGRVADRIFENVPHAKWVVVVHANDTTVSGDGTVWKREAGETVKVDSKAGYEGARGKDVTGYIRDEHGLLCYATWEA